MFGLRGFNLFSPHYNNSASFMGLVLFLPEAMHRVGTRVFVRSAYHNSSKHPDIDFAFWQRHILSDRNQTVRVRN
jgi:hypothetical protein